MMYESNECCGCATEGYPCLGPRCSMRHVPRYVCDWCGEDDLSEDEIEDINGDDVCRECARKYEEEQEEQEEE